MPRVIDLTPKRGDGPFEPLRHPAGVILPFEGPSDAALIIPEIRSQIRSGSYDAEMISLLDHAVQPNDRVIVIGAGLGVLTTLIAKREGVQRVIAVEANAQLIPYLERTHALNGVNWIETINGVLAGDGSGYVPVFVRSDFQTTSLLPDHGPWQQVMMVPSIDLRLILSEERITLIVLEVPIGPDSALTTTDLGGVQRILLNDSSVSERVWEEGGILQRLSVRAQSSERQGPAVLYYFAGKSAEPGTDKPESATPRRRSTRASARIEIGAHSARVSRRPVGSAWWQKQTQRQPQDELDSSEGATKWGVSKASEDDSAEAHLSYSQKAAPEGGPGGETRSGAQDAGEGYGENAERRPPGGPDEAAATNRLTGPGRDRQRQRLRERARAKGEHLSINGRFARAWRILALLLALALPLMLIGEIAEKRAEARRVFLDQIERTWGGSQVLTGPFLLVPVEAGGGGSNAVGSSTDAKEDTPPATAPMILLPDRLEVETEIESGLRRDGGREQMLYRGRHEIRFSTDPASATALLREGEIARWDNATLGFGLSELTGLHRAQLLSGGPEPTEFRAGSGIAGMSGIHAPVQVATEEPANWHLILELTGSREFRLTPAGRVTEWMLRSESLQPEFRGRFRPAIGEVGVDGFVAQWQVSQLAHALPQAFRGTAALAELKAAAFGVGLSPRLQLYESIDRATKLGFLLIVVTFAAVYAIEKAERRKIGVIQYALIGAAQCTFFLLLLSAAERIGFSMAFALAAGLIVMLLTAYAWIALGLEWRSMWILAGLLLLFAVTYAILATEQDGLLLVSILAFIAVAAGMWATRVMEIESSNTAFTETGAHHWRADVAAAFRRRIQLAASRARESEGGTATDQPDKHVFDGKAP